jgi:hypothetical protein
MPDRTPSTSSRAVLLQQLSILGCRPAASESAFRKWRFFVAVICLFLDFLCASPLFIQAQTPVPSVALQEQPQSTPEKEWRATERSRLHNEASQHWLNGELEKAISCQLQQLEIETQLFGAASARLVTRYDTLYKLHMELGDFAAAERFLEQACQSLLQNTSPEDWQAADVARKKAVFQIFQALSVEQRQVLFGYSREQYQHLQKAQFGAALMAAENLARLLSEYLGEQHPDWVDAVAGIEVVNMAQGKLDNTAAQLARLYAILEQVEHPQHPNFGKLQWLLATLAALQNDSEAALRYCRAAIEQYEKASFTHDVNYVRSLSQYASTLHGLGQIEQALPIYRKAYQLWTYDLAIDDDQETIISRDLCFALQQQAQRAIVDFQWDVAEALLQEAHQVAQQTWSVDNYRSQDIVDELTKVTQARSWTDKEKATFNLLVSTQANLAEQVAQKNFAEAIQLAGQCYKLASELYGLDAKATVKTELDRTLLRIRYGRFSNNGLSQFIDESLDFIARHELAFGKNHPQHAELCFLASELIAGKHPQAIELARVSQQSYRHSLSAISEEFLVVSTHLGALLAAADEAECEKLLIETIEKWESGPSRGCYRHCMATLWLGKYYYDAGYNYEARIQLAKAVRMIRLNEAVSLYELADALNYLANTYFDEEDYRQSLAHYREAIALYRKHGETSTAGVFRLPQWLLYNTAENCYYLGNYAEAEELLNELLSRFPATTFSSADAFRSGCYSLTRVLLKLGKPELAQQTLQRASQAVPHPLPTRAADCIGNASGKCRVPFFPAASSGGR